jgi:MFS family permease
MDKNKSKSAATASRIRFRFPDEAPVGAAIEKFRWAICTLLFLGISKNSMDRQVLGVLKTTWQHNLGGNEIDYSNLVFVFQAAYAAGMVMVGRFIDRVGTRVGYAASIVFWSVAAMAQAACRSILGLTFARAALGLGESAAFPASIKTLTEWFPQKKRALATGIFHAGSNVGAILTPLIVPGITIHWRWRWAFLVSGVAGPPLVPSLDNRLQSAGGASALFAAGVGIYSERQRAVHCETTLGYPSGIPTDVGLSDCQVSHRSRLVVLSFLAARIPSERAWLEPGAVRLLSGCNLGDLRCWQRRRRVAFVSADPGWVFCECRKENSDAGLRSLGDADRIGVPWPSTLAVRSIDWSGGSRAPGVLRFVYHHF